MQHFAVFNSALKRPHRETHRREEIGRFMGRPEIARPICISFPKMVCLVPLLLGLAEKTPDFFHISA